MCHYLSYNKMAAVEVNLELQLVATVATTSWAKSKDIKTNKETVEYSWQVLRLEELFLI